MTSSPYTNFLCLVFISTVFCTNSKPLTVNLTRSLFQHLDPDCDLILAHHNNFLNFDVLTSPIPSKRGIYVFHLPQINTTTWSKYPLIWYRRKNNPRGIYAISQKVQFPSNAFCYIGVIITKLTDFDKSPEGLSKREFSTLTTQQILIFYDIIYSKFPATWHTHEQSNLHISLLIRVQLDFYRLMKEDDLWTAMFTYELNLILVPGQDEWYKPIKSQGYKLIRASPHAVIDAICRQSHFRNLVEPPAVLYMATNRKSLLNLNGIYDRKESCEKYATNPFYLIREELYTPRAILFFSLVCLGNFTYGDARDDSAPVRKHKPVTKQVFGSQEIIQIDMPRVGPGSAVFYVTTVTQGFSFMTCYSREQLSLKMFLKPFEPGSFYCWQW